MTEGVSSICKNVYCCTVLHGMVGYMEQLEHVCSVRLLCPATIPRPLHPRLASVPQEAQQDALLSFERVMQSALARDWAADKGRLFRLMAPATAGADQGAGPLGGLSFGSLTTLPPAGECPAHVKPHCLVLCNRSNQCSLPQERAWATHPQDSLP